MTRATLPRDASPRAGRPWAGGFNLLPWRHRASRQLLRRLLLEWLAAALLGGACAGFVVGWQLWQRARIDTRREVLERSLANLRGPLAEAQRLAYAADERRTRAQSARQRARPLARVLALAQALAHARPDGVALQQLLQQEDETWLQATADGEAPAAAWLDRLRTLPEVETVTVRELKRAGRPGGDGPIRMSAQLVWRGASAPPARPGRRDRVDARGVR